jgi:hypothetical protein
LSANRTNAPTEASTRFTSSKADMRPHRPETATPLDK